MFKLKLEGEIEFKSTLIKEKPLPEGLILSISIELRSAFGFNEPDYSKDILSVNLPVIITNEQLEQFTIDFIEIDSILQLRIRWDNTKIIVPIVY